MIKRDMFTYLIIFRKDEKIDEVIFCEDMKELYEAFEKYENDSRVSEVFSLYQQMGDIQTVRESLDAMMKKYYEE